MKKVLVDFLQPIAAWVAAIGCRKSTSTFLLLFLVACQTSPTRVRETQRRDFEQVIAKSQKPIAITENTVVLDARAAFDYGLNRVEGSHHMTWESLAENPETGEVLRDRRRLAQRLALFGLTPNTPTIVVGYGPRGEGQEGRLAWTLLYLGFQDVQTAGLELFRKNWTNKPSDSPKNVPPVEIEGNIALVTSKEEFKRLSRDPQGRKESRVHIIDVRSEKEYFSKKSDVSARPDIQALNIEWKEFYSSDGRPNIKMKKKLNQLGIQDSDRVILVSNRGVRSAAAAYALISLGFHRVENFIGGFHSL